MGVEGEGGVKKISEQLVIASSTVHLVVER